MISWHVDLGEPGKSLISIERIKHVAIDAQPVIARAYYQNKDYARVVGLLEKETIIKNYPVLILLGNSCLELKKYQKAAEYFEDIRKYGDTVENNRILGAVYYSLGEREKAQVCYDRAKKLEEKLKDKNSEIKKEPFDSLDHQNR